MHRDVGHAHIPLQLVWDSEVAACTTASYYGSGGL
jgi:hypothetical protein